MRVHVTGGSGFLGGRVIPLLVARGHHVTALARTNVAADRVVALGATPLLGDLDDPASIDAAFLLSEADVLVNLASLGFGHAPAIVSAAEEAGLRRAIFVSTTSIFTRLPTSSKPVRLAAERTVQSSALDWTILRPTMIYGAAGDRNMAQLLRGLRRLPALPLPGGGRGLQQPVHVDDLAEAIVTAIGVRESIGRAYDLAGPEALPLRVVIEQAARAVGRRPRLIGVPQWLAFSAVRLYESLVRNPRLSSEQVARLGEDKAFDIGPAQSDLGFSPRPFRDGIQAEAALI